MTDYDLGIEGGTVVSASGRRRANVYVAGERIAAVTEERHRSRQSFDATGLLVMPGMVDAHVHFMDPGDAMREDFPTATAAALGAGVTTVIEHTHARPVRNPSDLAEKLEHLHDRSRADFGLGAHAWPDEAEAAVASWRAGAAFIKAFTCSTHGVPGHDAARLHDLFRALAAAGGACLLHCEDESMTAEAESRLRAERRGDGGIVPEWRSPEAEEVAVATAAVLARRTGVRAVLAHASQAAVVEAARPMTVESCPQYLTLLESEVLEHGALRKFTPPARAHETADLETMWLAAASGGITYIASDHAPSTRAQKLAASIWDCHFGLPGIDTTFSVLLDGAARGRITYERVVALYATEPAAVYQLRGKGRLDRGCDADIVLVDPDVRWLVADADIRSRAGWTPFAGRTLRGRAVRTYLRGALAAAGGEIYAEPGAGRFIPGPGKA